MENTVTSPERYNRIAIILHWLIAIFIIGLVPVGLWMEDAPKEIQLTVFQLHKSFGLMVLFLSLARIGWRLLNPPPPLPITMKAWEKFAAHATHLVFYGLIIVIPLSGWAMVSASPKNIPTMFLTLFNWPHIWFLAQLGMEQKKALADGFHEVHELLAFGAIGLLLLHVGAALKHQFLNKDDEMVRMIPVLGKSTPPTHKPRGALLVFAVMALAFALLAFIGGQAASTRAVTPNNGTAQNPIPAAGNWQVNAQTSTLGFNFNHAGSNVQGQFANWTADISFDPDNLSAAHIVAHIDLGSASTGDSTYDKTLPEGDWFDVAGASHAVFESQSVNANGDGGYVMTGVLQLRGIKLPVTINFSLNIDGDEAVAEGRGSIDRLAFGIGASTDGTATFVSQMVQINLRIEAQRRRGP